MHVMLLKIVNWQAKQDVNESTKAQWSFVLQI